ncbi:response regulator [candidate division KSB1 bacterium]|nr:response regulator [candidate division KSB1 bacterium]
MMKQEAKRWIITSIIVVCLMNLACGQIQLKKKKQPHADNGILDLTAWNFEHDGSVQLSGQWELYWDQILNPEDFDTSETLPECIFIKLPSYWNRSSAQGNPLCGDGYATYRLRVNLPPCPQQLAMIALAFTASRVYVNGTLIATNGIVGTTRDTMEPALPETTPIIIPKTVDNSHLNIIIQVSNFQYFKGGAYSIRLGTYQQMRTSRERKLAFDLFLFGSLFIIGIYHLLMFFVRRTDRSPLYFGSLCLLLAIRTLAPGSQVYFLKSIFESIGWEWGFKLAMISFGMSLPLVVMFTYSLFPKEFPLRFPYIPWLIGGVHACIVLFTSSNIHSSYPMLALVIASTVIFFYLFYIVLRAVIRRRPGSTVFLFGFLCLFITVMNDFFFTYKIVHTGMLVPFGLFLFIFSQSFLLAHRFSTTLFQVENLSHELDAKNTKLLHLDKLKDEFIANTTHELRTPLNGIIGLAESLIDGTTGTLSNATKHSLEMIVSSGNRLTNLVNDLLDYSKIKHHDLKLNKQALDLRSVVDVVLTFSKPLVGYKQVELVNHISPDLPLVHADENRVQQMLYNLVGNAIKFTKEGSVRVSGRALPHTPDSGNGEMVEVTVSDTGIGIIEENFTDIFTPFEQVDASAPHDYSGTGLGLAITKQLAELHGGEVSVASKPELGSNFSFTLPVYKDTKSRCKNHIHIVSDTELIHASTAFQPVMTSHHAAGQYHVLVIDDEPVNQQVLLNHLAQEEFSVTLAVNGEQALNILEQDDSIDLILLDIMMPGMSGFEFCEKIRRRYLATELPIIMVTAKNQLMDIVTSFSVGANDYLAKPFSKQELLARIRMHLNLLNINSSYARFVPQEFLHLLKKESIIDVKLGDQVQQEMTMLFADIRDFTSISKRMSPQENFNFINSYLSVMEPVIIENNGFIDRYNGDAITALFTGSADDAVNASIAMLRQLTEYNRDPKLPVNQPIRISSGINSGMLMLGAVGSQHRMDGTVISDAVNVTSGIEKFSKLYGASIAVGEQTFSKLANQSTYHSRFLGKLKIKDHNNVISVVEIFDGDPDKIIALKSETKADFENGLALYYAKAFSEAASAFKRVLKANPNDKPADEYLKRALFCDLNGVYEFWDGVEWL